MERVLRFIGLGETNKVVHLHGLMSDIMQGEGLVVGIDKGMNGHEGCDFLYKANQESYNNTGIKKAVENAKRLIFFGCSMGVSDTWYFNMIFRNPNIKVVEIYDYGQEKSNEFNSKIERFSKEKLDDYKEHTRLKYYDASNVSSLITIRNKFNQSYREYLEFL